MRMKLSVIIPYYNTDALVGRALDSLLDQDLAASDYEIIVVDDGSSEEPVVLKDYARRYPQVNYYRLNHTGLSPARNFGMSLAKGDWLYFCDSDDYVQRQVLGRIIAVAEERGLEMINAACLMLKPSDPVPAPKRNFSNVSETRTGMEYLGNPPSPMTCGLWVSLFRRSFIEALGLRFENVFYVEDCLFKLQVFKHASKVAFIDVELYFYIYNEKSIMHSGKRRNCAAFAEAKIRGIEAKMALVDDPATPEQTALFLKDRCVDDVIGLFINVFRYSTVQETMACYSRLEALGAYPVGKTKSKSGRIMRALINRKHLWIFMCRIYHILPLKLRQRL